MSKPKSYCNAPSAVMFVHKYMSDAAMVVRQLDVPTENILGLAAQESQYGIGRIAATYNNYFSMHAPAPFQTGAEYPLGSKQVKVATYSSFLNCAQSFAARYGNAVRGKKDPVEFVKALVAAGFNPADSSKGGRDGFVGYCSDVIVAVRARMGCPAK